MKKRSFLSLLHLSRLIFSGSLILLLLSLGIGACSGSSATHSPADAKTSGDTKAGDLEVVEKTDAYGNTERYSRRTEDYAKEGQYSLISPEGNLLETAEYHHDTLHGFRVLYYENGDTQAVERYDYGI